MLDKRDQSTQEGIAVEDRARWERVRNRLRAELGEAVYSSWFTRLELDRIDGRTMQLTVPTKFLKSWVQSHYASRIKARVGSEFKSVERVLIDVRSSARKAKLRDSEGDQPLEHPPAAITEKPAFSAVTAPRAAPFCAC
jgi:chromosomal replication initiator protein